MKVVRTDMAVGTTEYSIKELNAKTNTEIQDFLKKSKEELFNLRFQLATGQLSNSSRLKAVKHDIARMYTVLRERELGITTEPEESEQTEKKSSTKKTSTKKASEKKTAKKSEE